MFPFRPPFLGYPYNNFYNYQKQTYSPYYIPRKKSTIENTVTEQKNLNSNNTSFSNTTSSIDEKKDSVSEPNNDYFFEIFGLKLYFDDILLICLIFFLYEEGVKDYELFISLILLLLS